MDFWQLGRFRRSAAASMCDLATSTGCIAPPTLEPFLPAASNVVPTAKPASGEQRQKKVKTPAHLTAGPILLAFTSALTTMALQFRFTDWQQLAMDEQGLSDFFSRFLPDSAVLQYLQHEPWAAHTALYASLFSYISFIFLMPAAWPIFDESAMAIPYRRRNMRQHRLNAIDFSYVTLNSLVMPGFYYEFFCLMRSWGLDLVTEMDTAIAQNLAIADAAMSADATTAMELLLAQNAAIAQAAPVAVASLAVYFLVYEFIYYWWHRSTHESPVLYKWVHMHHHQQEYPDRPAIDTLNTGCVESQVGLYMQLAVLWGCGALLGVKDPLAAFAFFTIAGWLSVLEHDKVWWAPALRCAPVR